MKSRQPSKLRYESSHGATRKLTGPQKLAELACERIAAHRHQSLPARFWTTSQWAGVYNMQLRFANALLKIYDPEVVFRAFRHAPHVWSLGAPFLSEWLVAEDKLYRAELTRAEEAAPVPVDNTVATPRARVQSGRSARAKLNRLDAKEDAGGSNAATR